MAVAAQPEHWALQQSVAPSVEPVTLAEAKAHMNVSWTDDDTMINSIITAAREHVEAFTQRQLITATYVLYLRQFYPTIYLPRPKLISVSSVAYVDTNGDTQTVTASDYVVNAVAEPGQIQEAHDKFWPAERRGEYNSVRVTYAAGYGGTAADVPGAIKQAILALVSTMYSHREDVVTGVSVSRIPEAVDRLLMPYATRFEAPWPA